MSWLVAGEAIASGQDPGADEVLRRYDRARRPDILSRTFAIDIANRSLLNDFLPLQPVRAVGMHLLGAIANAGKYLELSIEGADYYPWQQGLFVEDPYRVTDGHVTIPSSPGWGVEVNPQWLAASEYRCSRS